MSDLPEVRSSWLSHMQVLVLLRRPSIRWPQHRSLHSGNTMVSGPLRLAPYLEVHCTYKLLSNCRYTPIISRVTVVMGLIFRL